MSNALYNTRNNRTQIKEELVAITGDFRAAAILHKMFEWIADGQVVDDYIQELNESRQSRGRPPYKIPMIEGWIRVAVQELADALMIGARSTITKSLESLVEDGFLRTRASRLGPTDRAREYRPDPHVIIAALSDAGFTPQAFLRSNYAILLSLEEAEKD